MIYEFSSPQVEPCPLAGQTYPSTLLLHPHCSGYQLLLHSCSHLLLDQMASGLFPAADQDLLDCCLNQNFLMPPGPPACRTDAWTWPALWPGHSTLWSHHILSLACVTINSSIHPSVPHCFAVVTLGMVVAEHQSWTEDSVYDLASMFMVDPNGLI